MVGFLCTGLFVWVDSGDGVMVNANAAVLYLSPPSDLSEVEPNIFLRPFLEVVRSEDTTGPITGLALTSVNKFLSYGLIGKISRSALILYFIFHISMLLSMCADLTTMVQSLF